jgi:hypothetical protein
MELADLFETERRALPSPSGGRPAATVRRDC